MTCGVVLEARCSEARGKQMSGVEETRAEIRFALSQLGAQNRHHEFEHLARALARMTISVNIIPATGPVAAGGDQGRDFETYRSELPEQVQLLGRELGIRDEDGVGFCCTLQQDNVSSKFAEDVATMASRGTQLSFVVAYCEANVPTAARHRLQERVSAEYGIHVEVFDGTTISELLAQRHTFWIAEQYLHLSARVMPANPDRPEWYEADLDRWRSDDEPLISMGQFVDLAGCLRYATSHREAVEDLPFWIAKMEPLLDGVPLLIKRKAQYEIVVARLRGLGDMRPVDPLAADFIECALESDEAPVLRDAAVLLMYCIGARARGVTAHSDERLMTWNRQLTDLVQLLLGHDPTPSRRCALLDVLAALKLQPDLDAIRESGATYALGPSVPRWSTADWNAAVSSGEVRVVDVLAVDRTGALDALAELVTYLDQAPLFPVATIAEELRLRATQLVDDSRYDAIVMAIDGRSAEVEGGHATAERARDRAITFLNAGRLLESLRDIHRARSGWFSGENSRGMLLSTLMTSEIYSRLRLHAASKYYALVAAAIVQHDDLYLFPQALFKAAVADYHQGTWFAATHLNRAAIIAHMHLTEQPLDLDKHVPLQHALFELSIIEALATKTGSPYEQFVKDAIADAGVEELHQEIISDMQDGPWWTDLSADELGTKIFNELERPPFADSGTKRSIRWSALGVRWSVEFDNTLADTLVGERLAATAQIILADLALRDPVLLPGAVTFSVAAGTPASEMDFQHQQGSDGARWEVVLPSIHIRDRDEYNRIARETLTVVHCAVRDASVLPDERLESMLFEALDAGVLSNILFGVPFDIAYADSIKADDFARIPRSERALVVDDGRTPAPGSILSFPETAGPGYSLEEGTNQAANRYETIPGLLRSTLPSLRRDRQFRETVRALRADGWLDWQILVAVFNVAANARIRATPPPRSAEEAQRLQERFLAPEPVDDPLEPGIFAPELLHEALMRSLGSTLHNWGLAIPVNGVHSEALRELLSRRYNYGVDDASHIDPFDPSSD
jgi:hypothetical protein